jgi:RNA polymerase sigma-70 factor (ECF subfamily)
VGLSEIDRNLLVRCLQKKPRAWEDFADRFMGLVLHVIRHTAQARSIRINPSDRDDLCAEVFLAIIKNDFGLLRNFRGQSSLATYLTVVARRIVVHELFSRGASTRLSTGTEKASIDKSSAEKGTAETSNGEKPSGDNRISDSRINGQGAVHQTVTTQHLAERIADPHSPVEQRISDQEQVDRLLDGLSSNEAMVVRMFHLEGKTYQEIGQATGMPENSIGPILSRARDKMRRASVNTAAS